MGYTLTSEETIRKARELASRSGRSIDDVIDEALTEKLSRGPAASPDAAGGGNEAGSRYAVVKAVIDRARAMPVTDTRSADEILGYNDKGVWD